MGTSDLKGRITFAQKITALFTVTYMASYITRVNFAALISEIENATGYSKASLSLCVTGLFVSYGVGQLVSGYLGDRVQPKTIVFCGLACSSLINVLMPLCRVPAAMILLWTLNGFAQAMLWPPIVLLLTVLLQPEDYRQAVMSVNTGASIGSTAVYLISSVMITWVSWKAVFVVSGVFGLTISALWMWLCPPANPHVTALQKRPLVTEKGKSVFPPEMFGILFAVVLHGALRDAASTWMPSNIEETFHLSEQLSILSGAILPMFSAISYRVAVYLHKKWFKNPVICAGVLFAGGASASALLTVFDDLNPVLNILLFTLISGQMHGINMMLVSLLPSYFGEMGIVSTVSGLVNSCTYFGSALFTYGVGLLADPLGWKAITGIWCVTAAVGSLLCILCAKTKWSRNRFEAARSSGK